jgi:hypothetical protein
LVFSVAAFAQTPSFVSRDVRPQGAADVHPLLPGMPVWIFGEHLGPPCGVANMMDPATYKEELCGVKVLFGGVPARLLFTSPTQINLIAPDQPWRDEMVNVQVIHDGFASAIVPVRFGRDQPILSLAAPAFTGMPLWVRVEMPYGKGFLRYPHRTAPWDVASGRFEVRFEGRDLAPFAPALGLQGMVGLPHEPAAAYMNRVPLHLLYSFDRPGTYEVRFTDRDQQSDWTPIEVRASSLEQRREYFGKLIASPPSDIVDLLADFLPSVLALRDETALRVVARYLDSPDQVLRYYARYALNYFDPKLRERVVPGREPMQGMVG